MNLAVLVARRKADLTQDALAARAGINQSDISRIERGWLPPKDTQDKLAEALGVSVEVLFAPDREISA